MIQRRRKRHCSLCNKDYWKKEKEGYTQAFERHFLECGFVNKGMESCGNCYFGAGRFWHLAIQNCMNIKTIYLIVPKTSLCKNWKEN